MPICEKCNRQYIPAQSKPNTDDPIEKKMKDKNWCWFCSVGIVIGDKKR